MIFPMSQHKIVIYRSRRQLELCDGDRVLGCYPIAVGKSSTPTPLGNYCIVTKTMNPGGVFGTRWMGLSIPLYGIHGTSKPSSIGTQASLGCVRMHNHDAETVYSQVEVGTPVIIKP
jgi:lipoprotein-anchoring transpeptidase ErfK/SrfK